jgi:acetyl esterase/lipase
MSTPWVAGPDADETISYGEHPDQVIDIYHGSGPLVTLIHGGYWRPIHTREHMKALAGKLVEHGFKVANIEYRREPGNPNVTHGDVNSALAKLTENIALIGFSVGGQLAAIAESNAHKLILLAPVTDLNRTKSEGLGDGAVVAQYGAQDLTPFDPIQKDYQSHLYLIHGNSDDRVPISHSRDFAKAKSVPLMEISDADHFAMIDPEGLAFDLILRTLLSN